MYSTGAQESQFLWPCRRCLSWLAPHACTWAFIMRPTSRAASRSERRGRYCSPDSSHFLSIVSRPECPVAAAKIIPHLVIALAAQGQPLQLLSADRPDPAPSSIRLFLSRWNWEEWMGSGPYSTPGCFHEDRASCRRTDGPPASPAALRRLRRFLCTCRRSSLHRHRNSRLADRARRRPRSPGSPCSGLWLR